MAAPRAAAATPGRCSGRSAQPRTDPRRWLDEGGDVLRLLGQQPAVQRQVQQAEAEQGAATRLAASSAPLAREALQRAGRQSRVAIPKGQPPYQAEGGGQD